MSIVEDYRSPYGKMLYTANANKIVADNKRRREDMAKGRPKRLPPQIRAKGKGKGRGPGSETITKKKQSGSKKDGGAEQTFYTSRSGQRMKKNLANLYKIVEGETTKNYYQFDSVNAMYTKGANNIINQVQTGSLTGVAPMHMVDLTCVPNMVNGVVTQPNLYHCYMNAQAVTTQTTLMGNTSYTPISWTQIAESTALSVVNTTAYPSTAPESYPCEKDRLLWSDIRLNLYGALNVPLTWHIWILKFKKPWLVPTSGITGTTDEQAEKSAFWLAFGKPLVYNPILVQDQKHLKDVQILKHDKFTMSPKLTTEPANNSTYAHVKTVKYFQEWDKIVDYSWQDEGQPATGFASDALVEVSQAETRCFVTPKERIIMVIAAEAFTQGAFNPATNGSYDIMVKSCHERTV